MCIHLTWPGGLGITPAQSGQVRHGWYGRTVPMQQVRQRACGQFAFVYVIYTDGHTPATQTVRYELDHDCNESNTLL